MAKSPPEPIEDFTVTISHIPKTKLGDLHAALAKLDLNHVSTNLVTHVATFGNRVRTDHDIKAEDFLLAWITEHPTFKINEAVKHFAADGRTAGACYSAARTLVDKRVLKKLDPGNYTRADVKHIAAPKKTGTEKKKAKLDVKKPHKTFDKPGTEVILTYARRNHGRFSVAKMLDVFEKDGRARNSVYAPLEKLLKQKRIKLVGIKADGQYVLLAKNNKTEAAETNGNGKPAIVEAIEDQAEMTNG